MKMKDLLLMIREIMDNKVEIEYVTPTTSHHYEVTPYTFAPKLARKIVCRSHIDLGQGILDCVYDLYKRLNPLPVYDGVILKDDD
jgi:UDP-glucose 4-epimerase